MQNHLHIVLLPLFLCVLVNTILISYSYSDCWNSVQVDCSTALNSVMAPKMRWTRSKRLLQEYEDENHNAEREVQEISNDQNVIGSISETGTAVSGRDEDHQIHPRCI
ncbi:uncharacterized protein LOC112195449 [Rosa chinensis]|uniref:uncharacterized protein LOC112195449 n=1 Tax=Rosa chinensis TaxID=74649 RepID=UPI001AD91AA9|nr:uncharacterized protein LOC112195449 [Rosa chinensis]